ncbi:MAG: DUF1501 domain-containing protein [Pirellulales bacterium]
MNPLEMNRRQALIAAGLGALSLGSPGTVLGTDKLDSGGTAVRAEKSCIFILLCGGPSHIDTWDMKPDAPTSIRGPYQPIATRVPGMRINEMHVELAKLTDQFTLINSMSHPGAISNHFDAMHNLLSGQSAKRVQEGVPDDQPYMGSFVAKAKPSKRNIVSNAWLIKCVGRPVFCRRTSGWGATSARLTRRCSWEATKIIRRWTTSSRRRFTRPSTATGSGGARACWPISKATF